jgi:hypothetical protein
MVLICRWRLRHPQAAFDNAVKLIQAGAHMVQLERRLAGDTVRF